ncbi:MAG: NADase-type glycan-binding domain-containing protein [Sciscionella sp.]
MPCPVCGTPNPPERQLCQHCAAPLRTPAAQSHPSWWSPKRRYRQTQRYGGSGRWLRRGAALVALVAAVIAGIALLPAGRNLFEDVRDKLGTTSAIAPSATTANAQLAGHPATALSDGLTNRYWGAPAVGDSAKFTFRAPFRLLDVIIHTGASTEPEEFRQQARAVQLDLVTTDSDGESQTQSVTLNDRPGAQTVQTGISDVVTVRLIIRSAAGLAPGRHIALGEVEFFKRN